MRNQTLWLRNLVYVKPRQGQVSVEDHSKARWNVLASRASSLDGPEVQRASGLVEIPTAEIQSLRSPCAGKRIDGKKRFILHAVVVIELRMQSNNRSTSADDIHRLAQTVALAIFNPRAGSCAIRPETWHQLKNALYALLILFIVVAVLTTRPVVSQPDSWLRAEQIEALEGWVIRRLSTGALSPNSHR